MVGDIQELIKAIQGITTEQYYNTANKVVTTAVKSIHVLVEPVTLNVIAAARQLAESLTTEIRQDIESLAQQAEEIVETLAESGRKGQVHFVEPSEIVNFAV